MPTEVTLPAGLSDVDLLTPVGQLDVDGQAGADVSVEMELVPVLNPHDDRPLALSSQVVDSNELTPAQRAILIMRNFQIDEEAFFAENEVALAEIMKLSPSKALKALDELFEKHFSGKLQSYITATLLAEVPEGHPDFTLERAAKFDHSVMKAIKPQSEEYTTWFQLWAGVSNFKNRVIAKYTESEAGKEHMHPAARVEYVHFGEIAETSNDLYLRWHHDAAKLLTPEERRAKGFTNELATVKVVDGGYAESPWYEAFSEEVAKLVSAYRNTVRDFETLVAQSSDDEDIKLYEAKARYYEAVAAAYQASNLEAFKKADTLLPGQNLGRTDMPVHIHTIEYGYGKDPIQRAPETHLRYPDDNAVEINQMALRTREDMIRELKKLLAAGEYSAGTANSLNLVKMTTYLATHFLGSGFGLDFLAAGQLLPNEEECRVNGGISVTLNKDGMPKRVLQFHDAFEAMVGMETAQKYLPRGKVDLDIMSGFIIASHEFGHNVALTAETLKRLGKSFVSEYIEEWKATTGGMVLAEWRTFNSSEQANQVTMDDLKKSVVQHIAGAGRYATGRASSSAKPYFRKSVMLMNVAEEVGVVVKGENGWDLDLAEDKIKAFYAKLDAQYLHVLDIYDHGAKADLDAFLKENLKPSEFIQHVVDSVDKAYPEKTKGAGTLEEICALS